jgi:hypothetical protein
MNIVVVSLIASGAGGRAVVHHLVIHRVIESVRGCPQLE